MTAFINIFEDFTRNIELFRLGIKYEHREYIK